MKIFSSLDFELREKIKNWMEAIFNFKVFILKNEW